jgi:hypothetical protein
MKGPLQICYHATNITNAASILEKGFNPNTCFAIGLEDAVGYGRGNHVFEVVFTQKGLEKVDWQFWTSKRVLPSRIVGHYTFKRKVFFNNERLRERIRKSNEKAISSTKS